MSHQRYINVISAIHYRADFGSNRIFNLATSGEKQQTAKHTIAGSYKGCQLFSEDATYTKMLSLLSRGYQFKSTTLSDEYCWNDYEQDHGTSRIPLFVIDGKGYVKPFTAGGSMKPAQGSTVIALVEGAEERVATEKNAVST